MVEARRPVHLTAAGAEIEHSAPEPETRRFLEEARDVMRARRAFEAVQDEDERRAGRRGLEPVDIHEVAVRRVAALAPQSRTVELANQRAPDRLEVTAAVPPRGAVLLRRHLQTPITLGPGGEA